MSWDLAPACLVSDEEFQRLLGYPRQHELGERPRELMAWAREWFEQNGRPWAYRREAAVSQEGDCLRLDGVEFDGPELRRHFRQAEVGRAALVAVSAGAAAEEEAGKLWAEGKPDEYYFLQVYAAAAVERLLAETSGRICAEAENEGLIAILPYSPGNGSWDVAQQNRLFDLIAGGLDRAWPEPLEVLSSGMLRPAKSLLAVFGLTARTPQALASRPLVPCQACSFSPCRFRRTPYRQVMAQRRSA